MKTKSNLARWLLATSLVASTGSSCLAGDLSMEFGYRYVMALSIRDQRFNCPDVKDVQDVGYEWEGVVMKVTCGPFGAQAGWADRPLRVTAYTEGDYTTSRWHEPNLTARQVRYLTSSLQRL